MWRLWWWCITDSSTRSAFTSVMTTIYWASLCIRSKITWPPDRWEVYKTTRLKLLSTNQISNQIRSDFIGFFPQTDFYQICLTVGFELAVCTALFQIILPSVGDNFMECVFSWKLFSVRRGYKCAVHDVGLVCVCVCVRWVEIQPSMCGTSRRSSVYLCWKVNISAGFVLWSSQVRPCHSIYMETCNKMHLF